MGSSRRFTSTISILFSLLLVVLPTMNGFAVVWPATQIESLTDRLLAETPAQLAAAAQRFGDPRRGAVAFYLPTMNCARCHETENRKRRLGPDLAEQREFKWEHLIQSVLQPAAAIKTGFETTTFQLIDGRQVQGILMEQTDSHFVVDQIEQSERPLQILKADVDDWKASQLSSMPDGLVNQLADRQQFLDLISYLAEIATRGRDRALELKPTTGTLAMGPLPEYESHLDHAELLRNLNDESLQRGSELYRLHCSSCHGTLAAEGSMPTSLRFATGKFKNGNDPFRMYQTLTHGFGMMNPQRWMVPQQKYEVIHYVREHFLKPNNPAEWMELSEDYLAGLPAGDTTGPEPIESHPWTMMDYGPSLNNSIEVVSDESESEGSNIAQKGIVIRLDDGPGGVESGRHWMLYEHDTMRVAGVWSGEFIDYEGIAFNGAHNRHPRVAGDVQFANRTGPGWARPQDESFDDNRILGRDGRRYGPFERDWMHFRGLYRFGKQTILKYSVGDVEILESPGLSYVDGQATYTRTLNLGRRTNELTLRIADLPNGKLQLIEKNSARVEFSPKKHRERREARGFLATLIGVDAANWSLIDGSLRLTIPAGEAIQLLIAHTRLTDSVGANEIAASRLLELRPQDLSGFIAAGPANYPQRLKTKLIRGQTTGPFAVDVLERPTSNPWNCQLRLTGLDFLPGGNSLVTCSWDGSVWLVSGIADESEHPELTWRRIAAGLFQPLGIKWMDGKVFVTCRDQLVCLHDLNGDGEMDWYENFNSDHQVTEHFHEFAMGLQTDAEGNFYYAKSARHALPAIVPHHGTLLKISADGQRTEILATGFRAANGVCLNDDGSFIVTDQEGHWNPKNRINWVHAGGFYGNMMGYHDVTDASDSAMEQPLCWITNSFDRSPSELLWVTSQKWGPLQGSLLNFSYGYGQIFVVPHESVAGQIQGGMCALPLERLPTGVMRGRFHPSDGQLYCCGMFAWAGDQQQPGGLYRIRYTGAEVHLPIALSAKIDGFEIGFSGKLNRDSVLDTENYSVTVWDLKRTENYGSEHYNERSLPVEAAALLQDDMTVRLTIPAIKPTWGMEIQYSLKSSTGKQIISKIHNTIHRLGE